MAHTAVGTLSPIPGLSNAPASGWGGATRALRLPARRSSLVSGIRCRGRVGRTRAANQQFVDRDDEEPNAVKSAKNAAARLRDSIQEAFGGGRKEAEDVRVDAHKDVVESTSSTAEGLQDKGREALHGAQDNISSAVGGVQEKGEEALKGTQGAFDNALSQAQGKGQEVLSGLQGKADDVKGKGEEAWDNIQQKSGETAEGVQSQVQTSSKGGESDGKHGKGGADKNLQLQREEGNENLKGAIEGDVKAWTGSGDFTADDAEKRGMSEGEYLAARLTERAKRE